MSDEPRVEPVTADERVSDVLARDEALIAVFVRHSPHFEKLKNRALRKTMARLVTVRQAAQVAGVETDALVRDLNAALGIDVAPGSAASRESASDKPAGHRPAGAHEVELDVRDIMRAGGEPFSKIMTAVGALPDGSLLHLRTIFEPAPLYAVLGKRGFAHETESHAPDDWSVWFWRASRGGGTSSPAHDVASAPASPQPAEDVEPGTTWIDVRGMQPPDPLLKTLAALETLPAGHTLVQVNVRVPQFLLPVLAERGYTCAIDESQPDRVLVRIWRP